MKIILSPSLRGRGLKYTNNFGGLPICVVALFTRAWIEIRGYDQNRPEDEVALFTRAWIEISSDITPPACRSRRPLYEGVDWNHVEHSPSQEGLLVALFTRAWIEITFVSSAIAAPVVALFTRAWIEISIRFSCASYCCASPSLRGRGLKLSISTEVYLNLYQSPSLRGRGLKFPLISAEWGAGTSPSLRGRGLKYWLHDNFFVPPLCRPLYEGVDWNIDGGASYRAFFSRPLYEGVDWNTKLSHSFHKGTSRPLYEGVDWNLSTVPTSTLRASRPLYEGVDWNIEKIVTTMFTAVALFTRAWIEMQIVIIDYNAIIESPSLRGRGLKFLSGIVSL